MEKLFKALIAFSFLSISASTCVPKNGNVVEIIENNPTFTTEYTSNFYKNTKEIKDLVEPVVKISFVLDVEGEKVTLATGTGFGIKYDRKNGISYLLTNSHICEMMDDIPYPAHFYFEDKNTLINPLLVDFSGEFFILSKNKEKDLCLMISNRYIRPAVLADKDYNVTQMEKVKIIGAPNGVYPIIIDSYISNLISRDIMGEEISSDRPLLFISSMIFGGQSGSPIYNSHNNVIGVMFMSLNNELGPIYGAAAIPLEDILEFLEENGL